jgi:hypothetical protein
MANRALHRVPRILAYSRLAVSLGRFTKVQPGERSYEDASRSILVDLSQYSPVECRLGIAQKWDLR